MKHERTRWKRLLRRAWLDVMLDMRWRVLRSERLPDVLRGTSDAARR
jgi:hypothetical protein